MSETQVMPQTAFAWFEINTHKPAEAIKFYTELFGWGTQEMPMPEEMGGPYTMLTKDGAPFGGVMNLSAMPDTAEVPAHWSLYSNVDDVDSSATKAQSLGGTVIVPAFDIPGVGRICLVKDTEGATIWLFKGANE